MGRWTRVCAGGTFVLGVLGETAPRPARAPHLNAIIADVCTAWGIDELALRAPGRRRDAAQARAAVGLLATDMGAATLAQVAVRFGRDIATISRRAARLRLDARQDPALGGQLEALQRRLKSDNAITQA